MLKKVCKIFPPKLSSIHPALWTPHFLTAAAAGPQHNPSGDQTSGGGCGGCGGGSLSLATWRGDFPEAAAKGKEQRKQTMRRNSEQLNCY